MVVEFNYQFQFNDKEITYLYKKDADSKLLSEELYENDKLLLKYNYETNKFDNNIEEAQTIDISKRTNKEISVLKFIYANTLNLKEDSSIKLLMDFVNNMLWFRS